MAARLLLLTVVLALIVGFVAWPALQHRRSASRSTRNAVAAPSSTAPPSSTVPPSSTAPNSSTVPPSSTAPNSSTVTPTTAVTPVSSGPYGPVAAWVKAENAKPGTKDWALTNPSTDGQIEGYANAVSVDTGKTVALYVSTTAPSWQVKAFRMGFYGGNQGRLVWSSPVETGVVQPKCPLAAPTMTVECNWSPAMSITTTTGDWPPGEYLFKLEASTGYQSYIPLTIRDDASRSAYLVNSSVTTWQAYNTYGGFDLYQGAYGARTTLAARSSIVSFDRPYVLGNGGGDFVGLELPVVALMESIGLDVSYTTDIDLSERPGLVPNHRSFVSLGHDEYYSLAMRTGLQSARDAGVNLIFLGANAIYRHMRLQASSLGVDRQMIDYKDPYKDPLLGHDNVDVTPWAWRAWPNNAPESAILGEMWRCNPVQGDMVIAEGSNWMLDGTGLATGSHIAGIVGPEYDGYSVKDPGPANVEIVADSPVDCAGRSGRADMTYYTSSSGAGVWDTGTIDWLGTLHPICPTCIVNPVTRITLNVLAVFGGGPAGRLHPSTSNAALLSTTAG